MARMHIFGILCRETSTLAQCCIMPQQGVALKVIFILLNLPLEYYFRSE